MVADIVSDRELQAAYAFNRSTKELIKRGIPHDIYYVNDMQTRVLDYLSSKNISDSNLREQDLSLIEIGMWGAHHERLEMTDELTGFLNNRGARSIILEKLAHLSRHTDEPFGIVVTDLKNFKFLNDNLGQVMGDSILRMITQTMKDSARVSDSFWRIGGDEFAWILDISNVQEFQKLVLSQRNSRDSTGQLPGWLDAVNTLISSSLRKMLLGTRLEHVEVGDAGQLRAELLMFDTDWINSLDDNVDIVDAAMRRAKKAGLEEIKVKDKSQNLSI